MRIVVNPKTGLRIKVKARSPWKAEKDAKAGDFIAKCESLGIKSSSHLYSYFLELTRAVEGCDTLNKQMVRCDKPCCR